MDDDELPEAPYDLVMPFVVCSDHGGPYEPSAFAAGWWCGRLDERLETYEALDVIDQDVVLPVDIGVPVAVLPQLDLIAMHHGFELTTEPYDEEYAMVSFVRSPG